MSGLEVLKPKHIDGVAESLGWQRMGDWLVYDLYDFVGGKYDRKRLRHCDPLRHPRFQFSKGETPTPTMYMLPGLREAVKRERGGLWITGGESDMLTLIGCGIDNVAGLLGEGRGKLALAAELKEYGIQRIYYVADNDSTGLNATLELLKTFAIEGLQTLAFQIPEPFKDLNEWIVSELEAGNTEGLCDKVAELPLWTIDKLKEAGATSAADKQKERDIQLPLHDDGAPPDGLWQAIEARVLTKDAHYNSKGFSALMPCPFGNHEHDRERPGFSLNNRTYSYKCQKPHPGDEASGGWVKLAEKLGIDWRAYVKHDEPPKKTNAEPPPQTAPAAVKVYGWRDMADEVKQRIIESMDNPRPVRGFKFGFSYLDGVMQSLIKEDLFLIYTRPHMGKSTFAMQAALSFSLEAPGVIISPEMSPAQWLERMLDNLFGWKQLDLTTGKIPAHLKARVLADVDRIYAGRKEIKYPNLSRVSPTELLALAKQWRSEGYQWMIVDSMQNVKGKGGIYDNTVETMYTMQEIANTCMPILATAQANRGSKANAPPSMDEIEGGGVIEQIARRILMLNRPAYAYETGRSEFDPSIDPRQVDSRCYKDRFYPNGGQVFDFILERNKEYGFKEKPMADNVSVSPYMETGKVLVNGEPVDPADYARGI